MSAGKVRWSRRAVRDLIDIGDYIADDNPNAARRWVELLRGRAVVAAEAPRAGRKVPELDRDDVREVFLESYRIVYRVLPRHIVIVTIFEGRQPPAESTIPRLCGDLYRRFVAEAPEAGHHDGEGGALASRR